MKRTHMQFADKAGPDQHAQGDQGLCCPLPKSVDTVVYVHKQNVQVRCTNAHDYQGPVVQS